VRAWVTHGPHGAIAAARCQNCYAVRVCIAVSVMYRRGFCLSLRPFGVYLDRLTRSQYPTQPVYVSDRLYEGRYTCYRCYGRRELGGGVRASKGKGSVLLLFSQKYERKRDHFLSESSVVFFYFRFSAFSTFKKMVESNWRS